MWRFLLAPFLVRVALAGSCIAVHGTEITAKDLVQIDSVFGSLNPDLLFSYAPPIGMQRNVSGSEISSWAAKAGIQTGTLAPVCFERPVHVLTADEIREAIKRAFPKTSITQIDVIEICRCRVPAGRLQFTAERASAPPLNHPDVPVIWNGELLADSEPPYPIWARVRVVAQSVVVRARQALRAREVLKEDTLELVQISDSPLRLKEPDSINNYPGRILNRDLRAGDYLAASFVAPLPDVSKGSIVTVQVLNGSTRLQLKARAESAGNTGETITLINPSGLRRFQAIVTGPGSAQITLSSSNEPKERNDTLPVTTVSGTL